jgi:RimJ/RimL family protein N-acetyltransferase
MTPARYIETERLVLRDWADSDAAPFAAMNADPEVMRHFAKPLTRAESDAFLRRNREAIVTNGYGLYAVEMKQSGAFIGFVGLARPTFEARFTPAIEIGWRLARSAWGQGHASEAARAVLAHAFGPLGLAALVSFTSALNTPSRRVMERIGMIRDPAEDFVHPKLPPDHALAPHVLYRIDARRWQSDGMASPLSR